MVCNSQHYYELDLSQDEETILKLLEMTSLLNPLNKLEAADNTTTEPDPTNVVDEDNMFFNDYIDLKMTSRDNRIGIWLSFKDSHGKAVSWSKSWRRMRIYLLLGPFIASSFGFSK